MHKTVFRGKRRREIQELDKVHARMSCRYWIIGLTLNVVLVMVIGLLAYMYRKPH